MGLDDLFEKTLGAYVDVSKSRYAAKVGNPTAAQISGAQDGAMAVNGAAVKTPAAEKTGVVDRLKSGDTMAWSVLIGSVIAAAVIYRLAR